MLQKDPLQPIVTKEEVDMLSKLTSIVSRLRKGSTVAENMETFTHLLERINGKDPELAQLVSPHLNEYIEARGSRSENDFLLTSFKENSAPDYSDEEIEKWFNEEEEDNMPPHPSQPAPAAQARHNPPASHNNLQTPPATSPNLDAPKSIFSHYRNPEKKLATDLLVM